VLIPGDGETPTRRVYFLAVNHSRTVLDKPAVRRAIAHAINREKLLDDFFREKVPAGTGPVLGRRLHAALNGPYPAGSWACDPSVGVPKINGSLDLFDPMQSQSLKKQALDTEIERTIKLQLKYPDDDPAVKDAMDALCKQLQETLGFTVNATGRTPHDLRNDVESGDYQLAYYSYEFPDDTYPLWPLMAPVKGGENIFHSPPGDVEQRFQAAKAYRDFARVKKDTWQIHAALYEAMPFIPLWQLDPLAAVHDSVEAPWFDPLLVFTEIERWKVSPR
jgi:ABC-type transport system substrate-binding protein